MGCWTLLIWEEFMSIRAQVGMGLVGLMLATSLLAAEPAATSTRPRFDTVVKIAAVTTRDASGRAQRFTDAWNREFAVKYDGEQRVQSIEATRGPHISDIVSVGYAPDGKLVGVMFRSGYALLYDHRPDGTQIVRDSHGAILRRAPGSRVLQVVDGANASEKLAATAVEVESLMSVLESRR